MELTFLSCLGGFPFNPGGEKEEGIDIPNECASCQPTCAKCHVLRCAKCHVHSIVCDVVGGQCSVRLMLILPVFLIGQKTQPCSQIKMELFKPYVIFYVLSFMILTLVKHQEGRVEKKMGLDCYLCMQTVVQMYAARRCCGWPSYSSCH